MGEIPVLQHRQYQIKSQETQNTCFKFSIYCFNLFQEFVFIKICSSMALQASRSPKDAVLRATIPTQICWKKHIKTAVDFAFCTKCLFNLYCELFLNWSHKLLGTNYINRSAVTAQAASNTRQLLIPHIPNKFTVPLQFTTGAALEVRNKTFTEASRFWIILVLYKPYIQGKSSISIKKYSPHETQRTIIPIGGYGDVEQQKHNTAGQVKHFLAVLSCLPDQWRLLAEK